MFDQMSIVLPFHRDGKVRILATGGAARSPLLPEVPTLREAGVVQEELSTTLGLLLPAGPQPEVADGIARALAAAMADPGVQERIGREGGVFPGPALVGASAYARVTAEEHLLARRAAMLAGLKPE